MSRIGTFPQRTYGVAPTHVTYDAALPPTNAAYGIAAATPAAYDDVGAALR